MSGAVGVAKFLTPQPILAEGQILYEIGSNRWQGNTVKPLVKNAARVNVYIAMRIALAGVLCYAFRHYQPDAIIATVAGAAVSAPATALYWGGKCVFEGGKAALQNFKTPLTQELMRYRHLARTLSAPARSAASPHRATMPPLPRGMPRGQPGPAETQRSQPNHAYRHSGPKIDPKDYEQINQ